MKKITRPFQEKDGAYFWTYIEKAEGDDLFKSLKKSKKSLLKLIKAIPENKGNYSYAAEKWTVKTVLCHIIDTERIFAYRALCISRGDKSEFPGYDGNEYAKRCIMENISLKDLAKEFKQVRNSTISLFRHMAATDIDNEGTASGYKVSPRVIGWKISGHGIHHTGVLEERYLVSGWK